MRTIIAGGRDYTLTNEDFQFLDMMADAIDVVLTGGCRGVDKSAESWAGSRQIDVITFPADWKQHGKSAGPKRNREMAKCAEAVILFPGGRGTESMYQEALKAKLKIYDRRKEYGNK